MRLVAGSNPAARTINNKQGEKMSYHGHPPPDYSKLGIGMVNPLHQIELKLKKVQEVLDNIGDQSALTANDLKCKIEKVLKEG
jgi:hypothetical protein|tara:strand:+ start:411 stop:659 length:249 start_codon:yes stop_codon:yes gene_type:complete